MVVAFNRDENFFRKTAPAHLWPSHPGIFAGQDLVGKGTWLGVAKGGKFACLTNVRHISQLYPTMALKAITYGTPFSVLALLSGGFVAPSICLATVCGMAYRGIKRYQSLLPSRGRFVLDFLKGDETPQEYMAHVPPQGRKCVGFNLLVADKNEVWHYSNMGEGTASRVPAGTPQGMSNSILKRPWPKVEKGKRELQPILKKIENRQLTDDETADELLALLGDKQKVGGRSPHPGSAWPSLFERRWSSIWIHPSDSPGHGYFGTRSSSVVLVKWDGSVVFVERRWDPELKEETDRHVLFAPET